MPTRTKKTIKEEPVIEPLDPDISNETGSFSDPDDTFTFKRSHFYSVLTVLAFAIGVLVGYVVWGYDANQTPLAADTAAQSAAQPSGPIAEAPVTQTPKFTRYDIPTDGFPSIGPADAPITIVEFSDYQCPYCRRWHEQVYQPLLAAYPGQIRFVYRNLPLTSIHPDAMSAAEAAKCAGEQDVYWQYHQMLFGSETLGKETYLQYARDLSLNMSDFEACITENKYKAEIEADSDFAVKLGVRSTPTFFINGLAIVGAQPLEVFQQVIDKELAGEIPQ